MIIFHLSESWKVKVFILCDVIFLVRLQFDIDHSWQWKVKSHVRHDDPEIMSISHIHVLLLPSAIRFIVSPALPSWSPVLVLELPTIAVRGGVSSELALTLFTNARSFPAYTLLAALPGAERPPDTGQRYELAFWWRHPGARVLHQAFFVEHFQDTK